MNQLKQIADAKKDLLVQRKINIQINKDLHKTASDEAKWQILCEKLEQKIWGKPMAVYPHKIKKQVSDKNVIYIIGDIHYRGKQDDKLITQLFCDLIEDINNHKYDNVTFLLTGDNVDGEIHNEQQRTNQPVIDAAYDFINIFSWGCKQIKKLTNIYMVYGNHEELRLWGDKGTENNIGKLIGFGLELALPNVKVVHGKELMIKYKSKDILLLHGHQSFAKSKTKLMEHCEVKYHKQPDAIVIGHFHSFKVNQFSKNRWLIVAPALKDWASTWDEDNGYCGFGQFIKFKFNYSTPQINIKEVW